MSTVPSRVGAVERYATDERLVHGDDLADGEHPSDSEDLDEPAEPHGLLFCLYRANIPTLPVDPAASRAADP
jgi:hypothetical protein